MCGGGCAPTVAAKGHESSGQVCVQPGVLPTRISEGSSRQNSSHHAICSNLKIVAFEEGVPFPFAERHVLSRQQSCLYTAWCKCTTVKMCPEGEGPELGGHGIANDF